MTITDTFNRADSATTLGTTSDGSATWTAAVGTWGISTNRAYQASGSVPGLAVIDAGASDGTVQATVIFSVNFIGPVFRFVDSSNYWYLKCENGVANSVLRRVVAGAGAGVIPNLTISTGDVVSVVLSGSSITVKTNGTTIGSLTDSNMLTATKYGLGSDQASGGFLDDWSFTPAASPPAFRSPRITVRGRALQRASVI